MTWSSETRRFSQKEMELFQSYTVEELVLMILASDPLVALRILVELSLHDDQQRLAELVANPEINKHWQNYSFDNEASVSDGDYAEIIGNFISTKID